MDRFLKTPVFLPQCDGRCAQRDQIQKSVVQVPRSSSKSCNPSFRHIARKHKPVPHHNQFIPFLKLMATTQWQNETSPSKTAWDLLGSCLHVKVQLRYYCISKPNSVPLLISRTQIYIFQISFEAHPALIPVLMPLRHRCIPWHGSFIAASKWWFCHGP